MGIFSWLFSKNTESNSHIRKWIVTELEKVDTVNPDAYGLFIGLIHSTTQWGKQDTKEQAEQVSKHYLGDATIFEIACYTYYRLENWLDKNYPDSKKLLTLSMSKLIIEKFYTTLYVDEKRVRHLFQERLDCYNNALDAERDTELEMRILMTKGNQFDKRELSKDVPSMPLDSAYIKQSLATYDQLALSEFITSIETYCKKNMVKEVKAKQTLEQQYEERDYLFAMALLAQKDWVRACTAFTKVLSSNPKHYHALVQRGILHSRLHQPSDAVDDFTAAIKINPHESIAYFQRGQSYHRKFRHREKALADYSMAIELAPQDAASYLGRGELYDEMALEHEKKALENKENTYSSQLSKEFAAALSDYSQVIALEPTNDVAYLKRALLYARQVREDKNLDFIVKTIADFEEAIRLNWENGYLYKQLDEMKALLEDLSPELGQAINT